MANACSLGVLVICVLSAVIARSKADEVADALSPTVVGLSSRFYIGAEPGFSCTAAIHASLFRIGHTFGAGGGGELWQHSALIVEIPPDDRASVSRGRSAAVLRLVANATLLRSTPYAVYASPVQKELHVPMHLEVNEFGDCPPQPCLIPAPKVPVHVARPKCGWALPDVSLSLPITADDGHELTFEADVSPLLSFNVKAVKVWSSPTAVSADGLWQTPWLSLRSLSLRTMSDAAFI